MMRVTKTIMVPTEVTECTCDLCSYTTLNNIGYGGVATIMQCSFCNKDCCKDCRTCFWENDEKYHPDATACSECLPTALKAWEYAFEHAQRHEIMGEVAIHAFEQFKENPES